MSTLKNLQQEFALYCVNTGLPAGRTADQMVVADAANQMHPVLHDAHLSYLRHFNTRWNLAQQLMDQPSCHVIHYLAARNWMNSDDLTSELTETGIERMVDRLERAFGTEWLAYRDNNGLTLDETSKTIIDRYEAKS